MIGDAGSSQDGRLRPRFTGLTVAALTEEDLATLDSLLDYDDLHVDLRARIAELNFLKRRGQPSLWRAAPKMYLDAVNTMINSGDLSGVPALIRHSLCLAAAFRDSPTRDQFVAVVDDLLNAAEGTIPTRHTVELVRIRMCRDGADHATLALRCKTWATQAVNGKLYPDFIRDILELAASLYDRAHFPEEARKQRIAAAETYVQEADLAKSAPHMRYSTEAHFLRCAIHALRSISDTKERRNALHARLIQVQGNAPSERGRVEGPTFNASEIVLLAIEEVSAKSFREASISLASFDLLPEVDTLQKEAIALRRQFQFSQSLPLILTDSVGRVVKKVPAADLDEEDPEKDENLLASMHQHASMHRAMAVQCMIEPARRQILAEHVADLHEVRSILMHSPLVDSQRIESFSIGVHAGLTGDFVTAGHILVPQTEHAIRNVVAGRGGAISSMRDDDTEEWTPMGTLLESSELRDAFGQDHVFALQSLLGRVGANLRNVIAHGIASDDNLRSYEMVYFWWLVVRLCLFSSTVSGSEKEATTC